MRGAREHNLKNVSLNIPKNQLVVVTGPSGSGKSSLVMDTLLRECQRLYLESLGMITTESISKPKVEAIRGLSPAISVGRQAANRNPRSTVGTVTDIYTLVRILLPRRERGPARPAGRRSIPTPEGDALEAEETPEGFRVPDAVSPWRNGRWPISPSTSPRGRVPPAAGWVTSPPWMKGPFWTRAGAFGTGEWLIWQHDFVIDYQTAILKAAAEHYGLDD